MLTKQPMSYWRYQRRDLKNTWRQNETLKHPMDQKSIGCSKTVLSGNCIAIQTYLRKKEKSKISNVSLHLKKLKEEKQTEHRL